MTWRDPEENKDSISWWCPCGGGRGSEFRKGEGETASGPRARIRNTQWFHGKVQGTCVVEGLRKVARPRRHTWKLPERTEGKRGTPHPGNLWESKKSVGFTGGLSKNRSLTKTTYGEEGNLGVVARKPVNHARGMTPTGAYASVIGIGISHRTVSGRD